MDDEEVTWPQIIGLTLFVLFLFGTIVYAGPVIMEVLR